MLNLNQMVFFWVFHKTNLKLLILNKIIILNFIRILYFKKPAFSGLKFIFKG